MSPDEPEYRELLATARKKASESYFEKAKSVQDSDIQTARYYFYKAKNLDPENEAILKIENSMDARKADIQAAIEKAEDLMKQGRWDDAILEVSELQRYKNSYQELETTLKLALKQSFDLHFLNGIRWFEDGKFEDACREFQVCLRRNETSTIATSWLNIAYAHVQAEAEISRGKALIGKSEHKAAFDAFSKGIEVLSLLDELARDVGLWQRAGEGLETARLRWTEEIYEKALRKEAMKTKRGYLDALALYQACLEKIPDFRDCNLRIAAIRKEMALVLQGEGRMLLNFPGLQYVALAHRFFTEAQQYDASIPGLGDDLWRSEELCRLKVNTEVKVQVKGNSGYCKVLERELIAFISDGRYPFVKVSQGEATGIEGGFLKALSDLKSSRPEDLRGTCFHIYELHLDVLQSIARKTGEFSAFERVSSYWSHEREIAALEYLEHEANLRYREAEHPQLWAMAASIKSETQSRQRQLSSCEENMERQKKLLEETEKEIARLSARRDEVMSRKDEVEAKVESNETMIQSLDAQISDCREKAQHASAPEDKKYYEDQAARLQKERNELNSYNESEAPGLLSDIKSQITSLSSNIGSAEDAKKRQQQAYEKARTETEDARTAFSKASGQLSRVQGNLTACEQALSGLQWRPDERQSVPVKSAYAYRCYPFQVFGTVWVKGYLINTTTKVRLLPLETKKSAHREDVTLIAVQTGDVNNLTCRTEHLVTAKDMEIDLQTIATQDLKVKLDLFFREHHVRYWHNALEAGEQNHILEAGENLALFIKCAQESGKIHEKYGEATSRLQNIVNSSIE